MSALHLIETVPQPTLDPAIWLQRHGDYLYRHALFRLRDAAAQRMWYRRRCWLRSNQVTGSSEGRMKEHGLWEFSSTKSSITSANREAQLECCDNDDEFFDKAGAWRTTGRPLAWNVNPESALELKDFQRTVESCLNQLPERLAHVFILREIDELTTEEICRLLNITPTNLWVMLHRARLRLQHLLGARCLKGVAPAINGSECLQPVG